jgi:hypothetical protein
MIKKILKYLGWALCAVAVCIFIVWTAGPQLMKSYIRSGIGDCAKIPVLCKVPSVELGMPALNPEFKNSLLLQEFSHMAIFAPKGFGVTQETEKKLFYKKNKFKQADEAIYVLCKEEWFFANLFSPLTKIGTDTNYIFLGRVMEANLDKIRSLKDMFFVIMKSIFIPDLGPQETSNFARFSFAELKGFLSYNLTPQGNFFNADFVNPKGEYFKVYIRNKAGLLDVDKVLTIISTATSLSR